MYTFPQSSEPQRKFLESSSVKFYFWFEEVGPGFISISPDRNSMKKREILTQEVSLTLGR